MNTRTRTWAIFTEQVRALDEDAHLPTRCLPRHREEAHTIQKNMPGTLYYTFELREQGISGTCLVLFIAHLGCIYRLVIYRAIVGGGI